MWPKDSPYTYLEVRGTGTVTEDPEAALINELSLKYEGEAYPDKPEEERLIVRVTPAKVLWRT